MCDDALTPPYTSKNRFTPLLNIQVNDETDRTTTNNSTGQPQTLTKIKIVGIEINYLKLGRGPNTLLLMPGTLGYIQSFNPLISLLDQEKYTIIGWDPPGYGLSRPPNRDFSMGYLQRDADLAITLMETLGINKYSLLGWCWGGITALIVASKAVDRVVKLVMMNCPAYLTQKEVKFFESRLDLNVWPQNIRQDMVDMYGEKYFLEMWTAFVDSVRALFKINGGVMCQKILPEIRVPTLILQGALDIMVPVEHGIYLHKHIKDSLLEIYAEGKHALHYMYPDLIHAKIDTFLTSEH